MKFLLILFLVSLFILPLCDVSAQEGSDELLNWSVLAELPETKAGKLSWNGYRAII